MGFSHKIVAFVYCETHHKHLYTTKKRARRVRHNMKQAGLNVYRCDSHDGWHVGHLPVVVRVGRVTRRAYYSTRCDDVAS